MLREQGDSMKVWIDPELPMPEGYDHHCYGYNDSLDLLFEGEVTFISFAFNLHCVSTGFDLAREMTHLVSEGIIDLPNFSVHETCPKDLDIDDFLQDFRSNYLLAQMKKSA